MKKKGQNILFLISGIIFMCIAITPLVYFSAAYHGKVGFDYRNFQRNTRFFLDLFLSINFLILGLNLFLNNKIEKLFSIKRIFYVLIITGVFWYILMTILFPPIIIFWV